MIKNPSKVSILLSSFLSVLLFVGCIVGAVAMPFFVDMLTTQHNGFFVNCVISLTRKISVLVFAYVGIAAVMLADIMLFALLLRVKKGLVFTDKSVALIRGVSWCCYLLAVAFTGIGFTYLFAFAVAFLAVFLGLCLMVVKNVLEEAINIKNENDLTV